jgi:amino acid transporter
MSILDRLFGRRLATHEEDEQQIGPVAGISILGLDALSSAAYGPEAALTLLIPLGALGLNYIGPLMGLIIALLLIVYLSYRQTIEAYPNGGGSYTVARENLGTLAGLLAASALMLDYVLVVAVGISAGVGALISAWPTLQPYTLLICLGFLALIALVNIRGVKESGAAFSLPTYLFIACLLGVLLIGIIKVILSGGSPIPVVAPPALPAATTTISLWLMLHAFSSGCTAMTGVEAVSNAVQTFRHPTVPNARRALTAIIIILAVLLAGIAFLARIYGIGATEPGTLGYESVLSQLIGAIVGKGLFYYVCIGAVLVVLALSANTGFAGFPRLCGIVAHDDFLPHSFASRGRRLVFSQGIYVITVLAALLLIGFGGVTDRLIPLFAVGAFGAFTLSQAGMVVYWRRSSAPHATRSMIINGIGALATGVTLVVVLVAKFQEGAWFTLLLVAGMLALFLAVKRHYDYVRRETANAVPLNLEQLESPIVVVPVRRWDTLTHKALRFAFKLSEDVYAVQVRVPEQHDDLQANWDAFVVQPAIAAGYKPPQLIVIESPYRRLFTPLLNYIEQLKRENPERQIAVIIPELVENRWYYYFLHNQRAEVLKVLLLVQGGQRVVIINVPWYLNRS